MTVISHPASRLHFDALLCAEIKITHHLLVSLVPILQQLNAFSEELRDSAGAGVALPMEGIRLLNDSFGTLADVLLERNNAIHYYQKMSSFALPQP